MNLLTPNKTITDLDREIIWHPYTQMKTAGAPIAIASAKDALLTTESGEIFIDAISSWWVTLHGHANARIAERVYQQMLELEHVIFAGFTHEPAVELGRRLLTHLPKNQEKLFFTDNGSTAVEVGLKMAIQYFHNQGKKRTKIIAFQDAYHGDTFGAMSVGGSVFFHDAFGEYLFEVALLPVPVPGREAESLSQLESLIAQHPDDIAAFIFEPLVLGAGGMLMYEPEALDSLIGKCQENGILCIADEVMTGFGRTGKFFASDYLEHQPDIIAMSKGLTGGTLPMAITACSSQVYAAFHSDDKYKALYHGHSYTGNPVGCAAGLASMDIMEEEETWNRIAGIANHHAVFAQHIRQHPRVKEVRQRGTIIAIELQTEESTTYFNSIRDQLNRYFIEQKVLLRPLGNVVYILPPYCITAEQLQRVYTVLEEAFNQLGNE